MLVLVVVITGGYRRAFHGCLNLIGRRSIEIRSELEDGIERRQLNPVARDHSNGEALVIVAGRGVRRAESQLIEPGDSVGGFTGGGGGGQVLRDARLVLRAVEGRLRVEFDVELNEFVLRLETCADECLIILVLEMIGTKRILE